MLQLPCTNSSLGPVDDKISVPGYAKAMLSVWHIFIILSLLVINNYVHRQFGNLVSGFPKTLFQVVKGGWLRTQQNKEGYFYKLDC